MGFQRSFGKLGNRAMARLTAGLEAGLVTPDRNMRCRVDNISRLGCRLQLPEPPRPGATILLRFAEIEALGTISWVKGDRCGIEFAKPLSLETVEHIRWIIEHASEHEFVGMVRGSAGWR
jgi:hypothetical protein